jgi:hypothetical protein
MYRPGNIGELLTGENRRAGRSIQASTFDGGRAPVAAREDFTRLTGPYRRELIAVLEPRAAGLGRITIFLDPALFASFGLPPVLAPDLVPA